MSAKPSHGSRTRHRKRAGRSQSPSCFAAEARPAGGDKAERLQKVLASAGVASRRECERLIEEGRIEVDGRVVTELGTKVDRNRQEIRVDGERLSQPKLVYYAIHKPPGFVSTARDPSGRPRVTDLLPPDGPRAYCVGRLDMGSEGLILATNDGELANQLTHPRHGVEKKYLVEVAGHVDPDVIQQLRRGVHLAEGFAHTKFARIEGRRKRSTVLEIVLDEGRNREIRRLLARLGHKVQRLVRVAVGPVRLGDLPPGAVRSLSRQELAALHAAVGKKTDKNPRPPKSTIVRKPGRSKRVRSR